MSDEKFPVLNFHEFIAADGDRTTTDSRKVAAVFKKEHAKVLRSVQALFEAPESHDFAAANFGLIASLDTYCATHKK